MPITVHANGEPLLKRSSFFFHVCKDSACCVSANGDGNALTTSKASSNLLMTILHDVFVQMIVSSIQTN